MVAAAGAEEATGCAPAGAMVDQHATGGHGKGDEPGAGPGAVGVYFDGELVDIRIGILAIVGRRKRNFEQIPNFEARFVDHHPSPDEVRAVGTVSLQSAGALKLGFLGLALSQQSRGR